MTTDRNSTERSTTGKFEKATTKESGGSLKSQSDALTPLSRFVTTTQSTGNVTVRITTRPPRLKR